MESNELVTLIGITVTFLVSIANLVYSLRNNTRTILVNTVTTSRLKWIDSIRDKVSEYIAVTTRISQSKPDIGSLSLQRDTLLHQIVLHLNPFDLEDQKIRGLVDDVRGLTDNGSAPELADALSKLRDATGSYLKKEWNRVKRESAGEQW
jgi:hypothetical protein